MATSLRIYVNGVFSTEVKSNTMRIPVSCITRQKTIETTVLVDSGAGGEFIDIQFVQKHALDTTPLQEVLQVYNADETPNH